MSIFGLTDNFGFNLLDFASQTWHTDEYANWRKVDNILSSLDTDIPYVVATGLVNVLAVTYSPVIAAYATGLIISFSPNITNSGAATVNVNGLGAKALIRDGVALTGGELIANEYVKAIYDGTRFLIMAPVNRNALLADLSITDAKLSLGGPTWNTSGDLMVPARTISAGIMITGQGLFEGTLTTKHKAFVHADAGYVNANITYSTSDPSGGNDGDLWFKYT